MQIPFRKPGKYSQLKPDNLFTETKINELEAELQKLKTRRPHLATEVSRLAEFGDFSENVEYQLAKGKLRGLNNAIFKIVNQLNHAEIIKPNKNSLTVQIGNTVKINDGVKESIYQILGASEINITKGIISHGSPLGQILLGKHVGETAVLELKNKTIEYKILKIE